MCLISKDSLENSEICEVKKTRLSKDSKPADIIIHKAGPNKHSEVTNRYVSKRKYVITNGKLLRMVLGGGWGWRLRKHNKLKQ